MNKAITTMVAGALIAGAAVPAVAQDKPAGLSVRLGLFLPTDSSTKSTSDSWFAFGVDYKLGNLTSAGGDHLGKLSLSLDYAGKGSFRTVPFVLNYTIRRGKIYAFAGPGVTFARSDVGGSTTEDKTDFAYDAGVGLDFDSGENPVFLEGKFMGCSNSSLNGFGVFLGFRF